MLSVALRPSGQRKNFWKTYTQPLGRPFSVLACSDGAPRSAEEIGDAGPPSLDSKNDRLLKDIDSICHKYNAQLNRRLDILWNSQDQLLFHLGSIDRELRVQTDHYMEKAGAQLDEEYHRSLGEVRFAGLGKEARLTPWERTEAAPESGLQPLTHHQEHVPMAEDLHKCQEKRMPLEAAAAGAGGRRSILNCSEEDMSFESDKPIRRSHESEISFSEQTTEERRSVASLPHAGGYGRIGHTCSATTERTTVGEEALKSEMLMPDWFFGKDTFGHVGSTPKNLLNPNSFRSKSRLVERQYACVISSVGRRRMMWDMIWLCALIFDFWLLSFVFVFAADGHMPIELSILTMATRVFFCLDIILNFFTGYMRGHTGREYLDLRFTALKYLKSWFLLDLLATFPWEYIFEAGRAKSLFRILKVYKVAQRVKLSTKRRLIKADRKARTPWSRNKACNFCMELFALNGRILHYVRHFCRRWKVPMILRVAALLLCLSHLNGTLHALLHPKTPKLTRSQAIFDWYFESMWWAFCQLIVGQMSGHASPSPAVWVLDIIIFLERFTIGCHLGLHIVFTAMVESEDDARSSSKYEHALKYLQKRSVSAETQAQLLDCFNETSKQRQMQQSFADLLSNDVPPEMQKRIRQELWSQSLRTFDLIERLSKMHPDFIQVLSQQVQEEVYACHAMVCKEGEPSSFAYYILEGEVVVLSMNPFDNHGIEIVPFTAGMWCGEKALINPQLRRSGTLATKSITTFLVVSSGLYFAVISDLGLQDEFINVCTEDLWKGLCGRCGSIGSHWVHDCPLVSEDKASRSTYNYLSRFGSKALSGSRENFDRSGDSMGLGGKKANYPQKISGDLKAYISYYKLISDEFHPAFEENGVYTLQDLEEAHAFVLDRLMNDANIDLSGAQQRALSIQGITRFKRKMGQSVQKMLHSNTNSSQHYLFLSHYKVEAGTEAALMRAELKQILEEDEHHTALGFHAPIYLDSENLTDLTQLMQAVERSHNVVLMCTKGVLTRPWCLVEVATAVKKKIPVIPVNIMKSGCEFSFPDESFYNDLVDGTLLGEDGVALVKKHGFDMQIVCDALKQVFMRIAVPYSPHRPADIRKAELTALLRQCQSRQISKPPLGARHSQRTQASSAQGLGRASLAMGCFGSALHPIL